MAKLHYTNKLANKLATCWPTSSCLVQTLNLKIAIRIRIKALAAVIFPPEFEWICPWGFRSVNGGILTQFEIFPAVGGDFSQIKT
jgi:hypothetical protein